LYINYYDGCHGIGVYLCLAILTMTFNEECHLSRRTICLGTHVYIHYNYVHL